MAQSGLHVSDVRLRYVGLGQVLEVTGQHADGTAFKQISAPFTNDPVQRAASFAREIISGRKLINDIANGADRIASATVIAKAIVDGRKRMSLAAKFSTLADRAKAVPKALEARADSLLPRLDAVEKRGHAAFDGLEAVVKDAEAAADATEGALRMLSNGGPPLAGSGSSQA